jgi:hypothetical protein
MYKDIMHGIKIGYQNRGSPRYRTRSDLQDRCLETDFYIIFIFICYILFINILYFNIVNNLYYTKLLYIVSTAVNN